MGRNYFVKLIRISICQTDIPQFNFLLFQTKENNKNKSRFHKTKKYYHQTYENFYLIIVLNSFVKVDKMTFTVDNLM